MIEPIKSAEIVKEIIPIEIFGGCLPSTFKNN